MYSSTDEIKASIPGKQVAIVGYGKSGAGISGGGAGFKRIGYNTIDMDGAPAKDVQVAMSSDALLTIDFDNGNINNDYFGKNYPSKGHIGLLDNMNNPNDANTSHGDSGGPWFINSKIAAVTSYGNRSAKTGGTITGVDNATNSSFGEWSAGTRISSYLNSYIKPILNNGAYYIGNLLTPSQDMLYEVVFDMDYQTYGRSGNTPENITIVAKKSSAGNLEIWVEGGPDQNLNGMYYSAPANNIKALTIRGTGDNETIRIEGSLGLAGEGTITLVGRTGKDHVIFDDSQSTGEGNHYTLDDVPSTSTGFITGLYRTKDNGTTALPRIDMKEIEKFTLKAGSGGDIVRIEKTEFSDGAFVFSGKGLDDIYIGDMEKYGMDKLFGPIHIDGQEGNANLTYLDTLSSGPREYVLGFSDQKIAPNDYDMRLGFTKGPQAAIHSKNINRYTLQSSDKADKISMQESVAVPDGYYLSGGDAYDDAYFGTSADGINKLKGIIYFDGGTGGNKINYLGANTAKEYVLGAGDVAGYPHRSALPTTQTLSFTLKTQRNTGSLARMPPTSSASAGSLSISGCSSKAATTGTPSSSSPGSRSIRSSAGSRISN